MIVTETFLFDQAKFDALTAGEKTALPDIPQSVKFLKDGSLLVAYPEWEWHGTREDFEAYLGRPLPDVFSSDPDPGNSVPLADEKVFTQDAWKDGANKTTADGAIRGKLDT